MDTMTLGKKIAYYRKEWGMTQEMLANRLGVTNQAVSKWESGQSCPDVQLLPLLADIFHISMDTLFGREETKPVIDDLPWEDDEALRAVFYIGRRLQKHGRLDFYQQEKQTVEFHYTGPALHVYSDFSVVCENCEISGSVQAGDSVTCGDVGGSVHAGDDVKCGNVSGNVDSSDAVNCGNVGGSVSAGDGVSCGDIGGSVTAGDSVHCTVVHGNVRAGDGVYYRGERE